LKDRNGEADISTEQARAQTAAWVQGPDGDCRRAPGHCGAPGAGPQEIVRLSLNRRQGGWHKTGKPVLQDLPPTAAPQRLKRRADFLRAAKGKRFHAKPFTLQAAARIDPGPNEARPCGDVPPRFGFTVTKKTGSAVVRNRIRRRLREVVRTTSALPARAGHDYVLIARIASLRLAFPSLQAELLRALANIDAGKSKAEALRPQAPQSNSAARKGGSARKDPSRRAQP
jgi:ribonuclease P protein component